MKQLKFGLLAIALASIFLQSYGQDKKLALDDLMNRKFYPQSLVNLQWRSNEAFTWVAKNCLVQQTLENDVSDTLLKLDNLNKALSDIELEKQKSFPSVTWIDAMQFRFIRSGKVIIYHVGDARAKVLNTFDPEAENTDMEPVTGHVAFTKGNNLMVSVNGTINAVTNDADKNIVNGQSVHRNEFGIDKGTFWSPKGNLLAFYRMDQTMVTDYPLVNINERIAKVENMKYPMAGMKSHHVTVGIYNPVSGVVHYIKTGEPAEQYLTNISWSPDEKYIFIAVVNRAQDHLWLNQFDAATGDFVKTLFEETDKEYVEPLHELSFLKTRPDQFVWQSRRDGWNHLYLYNINGTLVKQLTTGKWEVTQFLGWDAKESQVYFLSTEAGALDRQLYSVEMKSGKMSRLTDTEGTHTIFLSPVANHFIDRVSSLQVGTRYTLYPEKRKNQRVLFEDINPLKDYQMGETTMVTLKADDRNDLYGRLIKPAGFDPSKKYPVLIYVYGGPHSQLVTNTWLGGAGLFLNYLAQQGYVVFTLDNRGTSARGADFEQCIHRQLGKMEMSDQMKGVEYLKSLPYVDASRIGLDGWSYGGFMTLMMKLNNPGVFKVASCGGPVVDWKYYEIMYGERYMDTPEENEEGYKYANVVNYIDKLEGKLLVMHGAQDNTVVWQNSLQFIQECILKGKQVDYFVYPNHEHNVSGKDRIHMFRKLAEYYHDNL
ncbi:MAG: DPP IV N-terminal domain-containing protein [Bacteroidales bacterium]|nr:DPP IV N-terminal domain-containing protein [Bacteroidales bacterium]